jgi:hypothetical protein
VAGEGITAAESRVPRTLALGGLGAIRGRIEAVIAALPKRPIIIGQGRELPGAIRDHQVFPHRATR